MITLSMLRQSNFMFFVGCFGLIHLPIVFKINSIDAEPPMVCFADKQFNTGLYDVTYLPYVCNSVCFENKCYVFQGIPSKSNIQFFKEYSYDWWDICRTLHHVLAWPLKEHYRMTTKHFGPRKSFPFKSTQHEQFPTHGRQCAYELTTHLYRHLVLSIVFLK